MTEIKDLKWIQETVPDSLQGCMEMKAYADNQIKRNLQENKRLEKIFIECERRIEVKQKCNSLQGEKNDRTEQTGH